MLAQLESQAETIARTKAFGFTNPILTDENHTIIAGLLALHPTVKPVFWSRMRL
jgi:hypothetical protein